MVAAARSYLFSDSIARSMVIEHYLAATIFLFRCIMMPSERIFCFIPRSPPKIRFSLSMNCVFRNSRNNPHTPVFVTERR